LRIDILLAFLNANIFAPDNHTRPHYIQDYALFARRNQAMGDIFMERRLGKRILLPILLLAVLMSVVLAVFTPRGWLTARADETPDDSKWRIISINLMRITNGL
jgi:hypothetical protein